MISVRNLAIFLALTAAQLSASASPQSDLPQAKVQPRSEALVFVADKKEDLPTGACYITAGTVKNCTAGMTQRSCLATATKVGGVADWRKGERCK